MAKILSRSSLEETVLCISSYLYKEHLGQEDMQLVVCYSQWYKVDAAECQGIQALTEIELVSMLVLKVSNRVCKSLNVEV